MSKTPTIVAVTDTLNQLIGTGDAVAKSEGITPYSFGDIGLIFPAGC